MGRYKASFQTPFTADAVFKIADDYLKSEGYEFKNFEGEMLWKKGNGWISGPSFIKLAYSNNTVFLDAWIKYALLPGVYFGEMGLTGFVGCVPKGVVKGRVDVLVNRLSGAYQPQPNGQFVQQQQYQQPNQQFAQQQNAQYAPQQNGQFTQPQNQQYPQQQNQQYAQPQQQYQQTNGQFTQPQQYQQQNQNQNFPQQ